MQFYRHPTRLHRIARLNLEAVSIGSVIAASVPAMSSLSLHGPTMLILTLGVFATPICAVLGARTWIRRGLSLR